MKTENKFYFRLAVLSLLAFKCLLTPAFAAEDPSVAELFRGSLTVVKGKVLELEGTCNAVRCGDINYVVEVRRLYINRPRPYIPYAEMLTVSVCAKSGLEMGGVYVFMLKDASKLEKDHIKLHGDYDTVLPCDYYAPPGAVFAEIDKTHHFKINKVRSEGILGTEKLTVGELEPDFETKLQAAMQADPDSRKGGADGRGEVTH